MAVVSLETATRKDPNKYEQHEEERKEYQCGDPLKSAEDLGGWLHPHQLGGTGTAVSSHMAAPSGEHIDCDSQRRHRTGRGGRSGIWWGTVLDNGGGVQ